MHPTVRLLYGAAGQLARALAVFAPQRGGKFVRALRARRAIRARYRRWGERERAAERPLLWMHAPSVGEGLQARPVLRLARERRPDVQLAYTFFSPSASRFATAMDVDFADYLPFDTAADARAALDALRPTALVFSKLDVWPVLVEEAAARGVRLGVVSGTLAASSSRRGPARAVLRDAYRALDLVGAIDEGDAERLVELGVRQDRIRVTGDTRYDQVWTRAASVDVRRGVLRLLSSEHPTLVAGSTWPSDEHHLLKAWVAVRKHVADARLIIAPHEPSTRQVRSIERWASAASLAHTRLDDPRAGVADVIVVDRVGVLGELYALADAAYVGGGFHRAGLHSVLEPAAFGVPVAFGPRHEASRDALRLVAAGGGAAASSAIDLAYCIRAWLGDAALRENVGERARNVVEEGLGAAERSWELVEELLEGGALSAER